MHFFRHYDPWGIVKPEKFLITRPGEANRLTSDNIGSIMKLLALYFVNFLYFASLVYAMDLPFAESPENRDVGINDYERGEQLFFSYQFKEALTAYKIAADKGHQGACLRIVFMMEFLKFGIFWDSRLLQDKSYYCFTDSGALSIYKRRIWDQRSWFEKQAESNKAIDWLNLGLFDLCSQNSDYPKLDGLDTAIESLERASQQGISFAYTLLSYCFRLQGWGDNGSFDCVKMAAEHGDPIALGELGAIYCKEDNEQEGLLCLEASAAYELPAYLAFLGGFYGDSQPDLSLDYFIKSAALGYEFAINQLMDIYREKGEVRKLNEYEMLSCDFGYSNPENKELNIKGYVPGMKAACMNKDIAERCALMLISEKKQAHFLGCLPWHIILSLVLKSEINQLVKIYKSRK